MLASDIFYIFHGATLVVLGPMAVKQYTGIIASCADDTPLGYMECAQRAHSSQTKAIEKEAI
jgi:hypothetical protein